MGGLRWFGLVLVAVAARAGAQGVVRYSWDVNGTGSNVATIGPGEVVDLELTADWSPHEGVVGFAATIYDIRGVENWTTGEITGYQRNLIAFPIDEPPDENNEWCCVEAFQIPPFFNPEFDASRPLWLFRLRWEPNDFTPRTVRMTDANHLSNDLYVDEFGSSVGYDAASGGLTLYIVPGPATLLVLLPVFVRGCRRSQ